MTKRDPSQYKIVRVALPPTIKQLVARAFAGYRNGVFRSYRQAAISILDGCYPQGVGTDQQRESKINYLASKISKLDRRS